MRGLTDDAELRHNVDWLTEVIRRFSDAAIVARSFTSVNMKSPKSTVKVDFRVELDRLVLILVLKWVKDDKGLYTTVEKASYIDEPWTRDEVVAFEDAIQLHGAELRAVRDEVVSRSMPEVVRFYGHWKRCDLLSCSTFLYVFIEMLRSALNLGRRTKKSGLRASLPNQSESNI